MAFSETIKLTIDVVTGNSTSSLNKLKTDLKGAETGLGKLKVAGSAAGDFLKKNMALGAAAAGTALVTFATKAVGDFQKVALGAGELSDKLGITTEEASRLQEVGADLGISSETLATSLGKMNKTAAESPGAFDAIGAAIARNADGTTDVNQTFLNTIDALNRIPDATERAAAAQKIFGRGWQQISELVGMGADELAKRLGEVSGSKIIDDAEVAKAREMRDRMDDLKDVMDELMISVGEGLVPILTEAASAAADIAGPLAKVVELYQDLKGSDQDSGSTGFMANMKKFFFGSLPGQIKHVTGLWEHAMDQFGGGTEGALAPDLVAFDKYIAAMDGVDVAASAASDARAAAAQTWLDEQDAAAAAADAMHEATSAVDELAQMHDRAQEDIQNVAEALDTAAEAAQAEADAFRAGADAGFALRQAQRDAHEATLDLADAEQNYADTVADSESTQADRERALLAVADAQDNVRQSADDVADALVRTKEETAAQSGETLTATKKLDIFNNSLLDQAAAASGPVRAAILDHIADLNDIPPKKASEIEALIEQGKLDEAKQKLADLSAPRSSTLTVDANTAAAQAEYDRLDDDRSSELIVFPRLGAPMPTHQHGGDVSSDELALVGEAGPELVALPAGSHVYPAGQTAKMLNGNVQHLQGGGTVTATGTGSQQRKLTRAAGKFASQADTLRDEAAALKEHAKALQDAAAATEDKEEKDRLLAEADKALEQQDRKLDEANKLIDKSTRLAERAADLRAKAIQNESDALEHDADRLHNHADALRDDASAAIAAGEAQSDALTERASSVREAVDAEMALVDAKQASADAAKAVAEADRTTAVGSRERADAYEAASQAALDQADAEVQAARERAEAAGKRFTQLDELAVFQKSLQRQAQNAPAAVGVVIKDLIKSLDFDTQRKLLQRADKTLDTSHEQATLLRHQAKLADQQAKQMQHQSDLLERIANNLADANIARQVHIAIKGTGIQTPEQVAAALRKYIRRNGTAVLSGN